MEISVVIALVVVGGVYIVRSMIRNLGVGTPRGKPDCGCGTCERKRSRPRSSS